MASTNSFHYTLTDHDLNDTCLFGDGERVVFVHPSVRARYRPVGGAAVVLVNEAVVVQSLAVDVAVRRRVIQRHVGR